MIEFAWPMLFFLIPLPLIVYWIFPKAEGRATNPLKVPVMEDFACFKNQNLYESSKLSLLLKCLIFLSLIVAAARPQIISDAIEIPESGRDLMLAVDLSGSMQSKDFEINGRFTDRLTALKIIASDFIDRRKGDRIGLILFGSESYLQAPLTFDTTTVKQLLMEAEVGLAGTETAMGDAIGLAVKQLRDSPSESRVLVLLTDGNNNAGFLNPEKAAELAAHAKLKVHTVAIGSKRGQVSTPWGAVQHAEIDEKTLKSVAQKTGGKYFRAYNTQELIQIYKEIDKIETLEKKRISYRPVIEVYYWPLALCLILSSLLLIFKSAVRC